MERHSTRRHSSKMCVIHNCHKINRTPGNNGNTSPKYNPSLGKGTNYLTQGERFSFWKSYNVDDAAFLFLNRKDIEEASALILQHFNRFGLTVHCGDRNNNEKSKTEAMHIPKPGTTSSTEAINDINIDNNKYFSFCNQFKYLGSIFTNTLNDSEDIETKQNKIRVLLLVQYRRYFFTNTTADGT
jgi:hypothetical protein